MKQRNREAMKMIKVPRAEGLRVRVALSALFSYSEQSEGYPFPKYCWATRKQTLLNKTAANPLLF